MKPTASTVLILQLYLKGGKYDSDPETGLIAPEGRQEAWARAFLLENTSYRGCNHEVTAYEWSGEELQEIDA